MTIKDIARRAGVSPSTVSRVLSASPRISEDTTRRVKAIMDELHYTPNQLARSLVKSRSNIIAAVLPMQPKKMLGEPFFFDALFSIGAGCAEAGYNMLLVTDPMGDPSQVLNLVQGGIASGVILLTSKVEDALAEALLEGRTPFVVLGHPVRDREIHWVDNDNTAVGYAAASHLIGRGCQRIGYVGESHEHRMNLERFQGYESALRDAGIEPRREWVIPMHYSDYQLDRESAGRLLLDHRIDGIVASTDQLALACMSIAQEMGLSIPADVSFVGVNNIPAARLNRPSLTSIDLDFVTLGRNCFALLHAAMADREAEPEHILVPHKLIERESVR